jgi:hypothetical protein
MGIGKILGSISPAYGAITGKGLIGQGMAKFEDATGMGGLLPKMAQAARNKDMRRAAIDAKMREDEEMRARGRAMMGMKKGGKIKKMAKGGSTASKRADGCAVKGKTKGRFV